MESLVDLAVAIGNWYTAAMLVVPLTILGFAVKAGLDQAKAGKPVLASGLVWLLALATLAAAAVFVPAYFTARARCQQLRAAAEDTSNAPSRYDPASGGFQLQPDPDVAAYLASNCLSLQNW